jgi:hypothetical protein
MKLPELKEPWLLIEQRFIATTADELAREVGPQHVLRGKKARAIARRQDCDDVLFALEDGTSACAVVHLTYSRREESDPRWPSTEIFSSLEEWHAKRMLPDHEDFVSA